MSKRLLPVESHDSHPAISAKEFLTYPGAIERPQPVIDFRMDAILLNLEQWQSIKDQLSILEYESPRTMRDSIRRIISQIEGS